MALFDDLGKKLTQKSQDIAEKTKNFTEIAKLNSQISDEEKALDKTFQELGKAYFEAHKDDAEEALKGFVESINSSNEAIAEYKKEIALIKGVTNCPACGAEVPSGAAFCNFCGHKMEAPEAPAQRTCANCGAAIAENAAFCNVCGTKAE